MIVSHFSNKFNENESSIDSSSHYILFSLTGFFIYTGKVLQRLSKADFAVVKDVFPGYYRKIWCTVCRISTTNTSLKGGLCTVYMN